MGGCLFFSVGLFPSLSRVTPAVMSLGINVSCCLEQEVDGRAGFCTGTAASFPWADPFLWPAGWGEGSLPRVLSQSPGSLCSDCRAGGPGGPRGFHTWASEEPAGGCFLLCRAARGMGPVWGPDEVLLLPSPSPPGICFSHKPVFFLLRGRAGHVPTELPGQSR